MTTDSELKEAFRKMATTVAQAIKEAGSIPSGHLYAACMPHMSLNAYQLIIDLLKRSKAVTESNHLLTWVGK